MPLMRRTIGVVGVVIAVDACTKVVAFRIAQAAPLVRLSRNPNLALGAFEFSDGLAVLLLAVLALLLFVHASILCRRKQLSASSFGLLVGGALANALDRLTFGAVHDWLALGSVTANAADIAILVGLLAYVRTAWNSVPSHRGEIGQSAN